MTTTGLINEKALLIENATAQNVYDFLLLIIKERLPRAFERTRESVIYHDILRLNAGSPLRDGISITTHYYIENPAGNVVGNYPELDFMSFKAVQISNNRVMLYGGCTDHEEAKKALDQIWQIVVETYSKRWDSPQFQAAAAPRIASGQALNTIADNAAGTVSYTRNDQGQTIIMGGTANPGYKFEIGHSSVAIKTDEAVWLNHTNGDLQPDSQGLQTLRKPGKGGRPHLPEDIWAWEQVNKHGREPIEVYKEWLRRDEVQARNLQDPDRHFNRIIKPGWGNKLGRNI